MHVGIVNWSLYNERGGLERNANLLAEAMLARGHAVSVFYQASREKGKEPVYPIPAGASAVGLPLYEHAPDVEAARGRLLRSGIDILVPMFSWGDLLWFPFLLKGSGIPMLVSERNIPDNVIRKWSAVERLACMDAADHIHVQTQSSAATFPPEMQSRLTVLPNASRAIAASAHPRPRPERKVLLGLGRFKEKPKQFSYLIRAFALIADRFPDWDLRLCGHGESYEDYVKLAGELGLAERVQFPGMVTDLASEYPLAEFFCLPSSHEGFPTVCLEAQHFSLPVVAFAACPGVNEAVLHGENGLLVQEMSPEALARALALLMQDEPLRQKMSRRSAELIKRYEPESIFDQWSAMLARVAAASRPTRIERIEKGLAGSDEARELLGRAHPFDRRFYLKKHAELRRAGRESPFTDAEISMFVRQMKRCCIPGYRLSSKCLKSALLRLSDRAGGRAGER